jgi:hypothetical protein
MIFHPDHRMRQAGKLKKLDGNCGLMNKQGLPFKKVMLKDKLQ